MNLSDLKEQCQSYVNGWQNNKCYYFDECDEKLSLAKSYVDKPITRKNPAVCFDDDETLISNIPLMEVNDWGWPDLMLKFSWQEENMPPLKPVQLFYNYLYSLKYSIFIITARSNIYYNQTLEELKNAGYYGFVELIMKDPNDTRSDAQYKSDTRAELIARGYDIVVNVGDHDSDLQGNADYQCKLPNYFY